MAFSDCAHEHWIWHSNRLWVKSDTDMYRPLKFLLKCTPDHVILLWDHAEDISDEYAELGLKTAGANVTGESLHLPLSSEHQPTTMEERPLGWAQGNRRFSILFEQLAERPLMHNIIRIDPYFVESSLRCTSSTPSESIVQQMALNKIF